MTWVLTKPTIREAVDLPELRGPHSPPGLRVVRITADASMPASHIYMESQVFTPDSSRFIFQRVEPDTMGLMMREWRRTFWLCDIEDGFALRQLTDEPDATAPAVSPDGRFLYYVLSERDPRAGTGVELRRVSLDTFKRETVLHVPGASLVYPLATIRSDGGAFCFGAFLGDGVRPGTHAIFVCDIVRGEYRVVLTGDELINPHPQYARSADPQRRHDILVQHNIDVTCDAMGNIVRAGSGCTLSVIRDAGALRFRRVPCGGDRVEVCHGHQEWRGERSTVVVGVDTRRRDGVPVRRLIEATPIDADPNDPTPPRLLPGADAHRHNITAGFDEPLFGHTAFDPTGTRFIGDWRPVTGESAQTQIMIGSLGDAPGAALKARYLLHPRSTYGPSQITHPHPFLSPDGRRAFFNSDFGGQPQVWMVDGFEFPHP